MTGGGRGLFSVFGLEVAHGYLVTFLSEFTATCPHPVAWDAGGVQCIFPPVGGSAGLPLVEAEKDGL